MDDMPVAVIDGTTLRYIESDHLNTPRALIDPARNVAMWRWDLNGSAFGEHAANEDPDGDATLTKFNLRFPGQYLDAETGLHYNYFRDYEPGVGRYVESDPIGLGGGLSTYGYVNTDPLGGYDVYGLMGSSVAVNNPSSSCYFGCRVLWQPFCSAAAASTALVGQGLGAAGLSVGGPIGTARGAGVGRVFGYVGGAVGCAVMANNTCVRKCKDEQLTCPKPSDGP